jgi:hypothetical protein
MESTHAWVPSKTVDGEWLQAVVVSQGDGQVTLETLETKESHTQSSEVCHTLKLSNAHSVAVCHE